MSTMRPDYLAWRRILAPVTEQNADDRFFDFELSLTKIASGDGSPAVDSSDTGLLRELIEREKDDLVAYAALYVLHIYFRRMKEFSELRTLLEDCGDRFRRRPSFPHLQSLYFKHATPELSDALSCATRAVENCPDHSGVLHNYADVLISSVQSGAAADDKLPRAQEAVERAISLTNGKYARYHATEARLFIALKDFSQARAAIDRALDREEPGPADYAIRIGEYQGIKLEIQFDEAAERLSSVQTKTVAELHDMRTSLDDQLSQTRAEGIQLLGLLAAVIAFVVVTVQISARLDTFAVSGRLIVLVTGAILTIYAGFGFALGDNRSGKLRRVAVAGLGIAIAAFALFAWHVS